MQLPVPEKSGLPPHLLPDQPKDPRSVIGYAKKAVIRDKAKIDFLAMLRKCSGAMFITCDKLQLDPDKVYYWRDHDPVFARELAIAKEYTIDTIEQPFIERAKVQTAESIFFLKTQAKHRGYIERNEVDLRAQVQLSYDTRDQELFNMFNGAVIDNNK